LKRKKRLSDSLVRAFGTGTAITASETAVVFLNHSNKQLWGQHGIDFYGRTSCRLASTDFLETPAAD